MLNLTAKGIKVYWLAVLFMVLVSFQALAVNQSVTLSAGWSSLSLTVEDSNAFEKLRDNDVERIFLWSSQEQRWMHYDFDRSVGDITSISSMRAYMVKAASSTSITFSGDTTTILDTSLLDERWNLITATQTETYTALVTRFTEARSSLSISSLYASNGEVWEAPEGDDAIQVGAQLWVKAVATGESDPVNVATDNHVPVAANSSATTDEDVSLTSTLQASDQDDDQLTYAIVTQPTKGAVEIAGNFAGSFIYTPNANENGSDSFTFKANDGNADSNDATVTIAIDAVNDTPTVSDGALAVTEDSSAIGGNLSAADLDGDSLTYSIVTLPAKGTLTLADSAAGAYSYTPASNENGSDSFTFKVSDGAVDSDIATVEVTINEVNDAPVATNDRFTINQGTTLNIPEEVLLSNDSDPEGDALTTQISTQPNHGAVTQNNDETYIYTPQSNFYGEDGFTYIVTDGHELTIATVAIIVSQINQPPIPVDGAYTVPENGLLQGTLHATDIENDILKYSIYKGSKLGSAIINNKTLGTFTYTPSSGAVGNDYFTYKVNDGMQTTNESTVQIFIQSTSEFGMFTFGESNYN
jgi:hypothetical protein